MRVTVKATPHNAMDLRNFLTRFEDEDITISLSGGFSYEMSCNVKEVKTLGFEDENKTTVLDTIFFNTDKGEFQFWMNDLKEIIYDCEETMAKVVLCFDKHYVHIYDWS